MHQKSIIIVSGIFIGLLLGYVIIFHSPVFQLSLKIPLSQKNREQPKKQVIGFLPYWLLDKASSDYSKYISALSFFGLPIDADGTILKLATPQQLQPGWNALHSGKVDAFLQEAKKHNETLSLVLNSGDTNTINVLMENPILHADNTMSDVQPMMRQYGFSDLNLDIEYSGEASREARMHFTQFIQEVKKHLPPKTTLTIEISTVDVIRKQLIDVQTIGKIADHIVLMAYDYHSPDSYVTGPIAPLHGAGIISEYDVATAIERTKQLIPSEKIILGVPLYGYEWETIYNLPRSATIPGTGVLASNRRTEQFLDTCSSCSATFDTDAQEAYIIYKDQDTETYHQIFYPNKKAMDSEIAFANKEQLNGIALWALGYEGKTILSPLISYAK